MKKKPPKWALWILIGFNVLVALLIFGATVYVSFSHTLALYRSVGFTDWKAVAATLAGEALFILGAVNAIFALLFGVSLGWVPWVAFVLGIVLSGWANGAAHSKYGWLGVALGLSTPVFMFVAKLNISNAIEKFNDDDDETVNEKQTVSNESVNLMENKTVRDNTVNRDSISPVISEQTISTSVNLTNNETVSAYINLMDNLMDSGNGKEALESTNSQPVSDTISQPQDGTVSLTESESINEKTISLMNDETINTETISLMNDETINTETISNESVNLMNDETVSETINSNHQLTKSNVVELASRSKNSAKKKRRGRVTQEEIERVKDIALQLREQDAKKELPGRPTLVERAGCSHHVAKMVLDELKLELAQSN